MGFFYISDNLAADAPVSDEGVVVLAVSGEIDYEASPRLRECISDYIKGGSRRLVLDLSTTTFIDSTAIGVLVGADTRLQEACKGSLAVVCPQQNERVLEIFEIAGMGSLIGLHSSREEAFSALSMAG
jgi:anti-sigma B factor antagonist